MIWVVKEDGNKSWAVSNLVTQKANTDTSVLSTYMNLGTGVTGSPDTNYVILLVIVLPVASSSCDTVASSNSCSIYLVYVVPRHKACIEAHCKK